MKEWMNSQGVMLYILAAITLIGVVAQSMANQAYKRLIKDADSIEQTDNRLIRYIKLKYSSFYKIGIKPNDAGAMVEHYFYKYKIGPLSLAAWSKISVLLNGMIGIALVCAVIYRFGQNEQISEMYSMIALSLLAMFILYMQNKLYDFKEKKQVFVEMMCDYLKNYLKNKLEYGKSVDAKVSKQHAQAAATSVRMGHDSGEELNLGKKNADIRQKRVSEDMDAKMVEDILKEFLN